jgi:hypothetical protein
MIQETKGKLEVSKDVVEQLKSMVRNSGGPAASDLAPRIPGPSPSTSLDGMDFED